MNRLERPTLDATVGRSLRPLSLDAVLKHQKDGATLLDVREPAEFETGHLKGSVNIGLSGKFATWAGTVLEAGATLVLIASPEKEKEAAVRLGRIGFDRVAGYLDGGPASFSHRADLIQRTDRLTPEELAPLIASGEAPLILDVRTLSERQTSRIADGLHIPLNELKDRHAEVPRGRRIVVHCQGGYRSSIAASLLKQRGVTDLADLVGGMAAWLGAEAPRCVKT
jgi:rhodanese-related sulfurtransferase